MASLILALAAALAFYAAPSAALSDSVCINTAATWVTQSPHLSGQFPFYNLMFFCEGDLNLESRNVDACINRGSACGQPAADEFCQYLGFEGAAPTLFTTKAGDGPARSMTGEWCIQAGKYQDLGYLTLSDLQSVNKTINGPRCEVLDSVVCFNSRDRLAANNKGLHALAHPPAEAPWSGQRDTTRSVAGPTVELPPQTATGGRRLLTHRP